MAPSHALREQINAIVRERLIRDGQIKGPALETERLISRGYTHAEKSIAANYAPGDVVGFHRPYKRLGVEKGDELRVVGIDRDAGTVKLRRMDGGIAAWVPHKLAARTGGVEVYRSENLELRAGDRIRWTRNDNGFGLINSQTAEVARVKHGNGNVCARGRADARAAEGRLAATPHRPRLGVHGPRFPGAAQWTR